MTGPASERETVVFFAGRGLMTVGIQELADCQFQNEVSSQLIEGSALNDFRVEATRWHNSASNQERFIYLLKNLATELSGVESTTGQDPNTIIPSVPLQEGLVACAGKTLVELRQEVASWGYFEKLVSLQNLEPDRSDTGTQSMSDPVPIPTGDLKVESLLDTLVWATNRFGMLSSVMVKMAEAANQVSEASGC